LGAPTKYSILGGDTSSMKRLGLSRKIPVEIETILQFRV